jgi:hypothetical protein
MIPNKFLGTADTAWKMGNENFLCLKLFSCGNIIIQIDHHKYNLIIVLNFE